MSSVIALLAAPRRATLLATAAAVAAALALSSGASAFSFTRTDYTLATWTQTIGESNIGSIYVGPDKPLAIADFNGDGKPDIAAADNHLNVIHVLLNDGTGKFAKSAASPVATGCNAPDSLLAGDFTGDGKQDLLVDCTFQGHIWLLPGDGQGGFGAETATIQGIGPMVRASVINHDDDVVYGSIGGGGTCYVQVVNGTLDPTPTCPTNGARVWSSVHWFDSQCGGDQFLGLTWTNPNPDFDARIFELGQDAMKQCTDWGTGGQRDSGLPCCSDQPSGIAATTDLDKDGSPDIVMTNSTGFHVIGGWNATDGVGTTSYPIASARPITSFGSADFDGDGNPDLAAIETHPPSQDANQLELFAGQGSLSQFGAGQQIATYGGQQNYSDNPRIVVADLNGDNKPDIVASALGGDNGIDSATWADDISVFLNGSQPPGGGNPGGGGPPPTPPSGPTGTPPGATPGPFHGLTIHPQTLTVKNGAVHLTVTCPPDALVLCAGTDTLFTLKAVAVRLDRKRKTILKLGSSHFSVLAGKTATLTIKLSKKALRLIAKQHTLRTREVVVAHDQRGVSKTTSTTVTIKAPKKRR